MRARVTSDTGPPPFRTLLVVWKLTPDCVATYFTETCRGLCTFTSQGIMRGRERTFALTEPRGEYPRPSLERKEWVSLNGEWEFGAGSERRFDRSILVPFCAESTLSGLGELPGDVVWYRRRFDAPDAEGLLLHFGAVDYRATLWAHDVALSLPEAAHVPFV